MKFLLGLIIGLLIFPVAGFIYLRSGMVPVATSADPMPFEKTIARTALRIKLRDNAPKRDLAAFTTADLEKGADVYKRQCAFCHTLPDNAATPAGKGMFPEPPELFSPMDNVTDDPVGVTYWKVQNGIRLSGMPSFKDSLSDQEMWDVSALLADADKLPPSVTDKLKEETPAATDVPSQESAVPEKKPAAKKKKRAQARN